VTLLARQDASGLAGNVVTPVTPTNAGAGDTFVGGQGIMLYCNNGGGSPITVTITTPETVEGILTVQDRVITVTNATFKMIPLPSRYNDPATGLGTVIFSSNTTVTAAVIACGITP
jgi:hypothetical protein